MKKIIIYGIVFLTSINFALAQNPKEIPLDQAWKDKITELAPDKATFPFKKKKKILVFSMHTGFWHWVNPHTSAMIQIISDKSGTFEVTTSTDIAMMEADKLKEFDAVVFNNTNSKPQYRNLFVDKISEDTSLDSVTVWAQANKLEQNIINYVKKGGGILLVHGGDTMLNNSAEFSKLTGGSFDYHTKQQAFQVRIVDASHPLTKSLPADGYNHVDEPYFYKGAYDKLDFHPLTYFNNAEIEGQRKGQEKTSGKTYVSWIRKEGKGRAMYISTSHNAHSFENANILAYFLDALQYVAGDVKVDETPIGK
ncbi:trehalose utilization protein [Algoriphagus ratkowskyi]|uniref:ThuA domain-containing protein n=1 Tax=Algoriphagus ratkowskyi TaxID=57028 RepID=A0A2W7RX23_9BACT|nr:ThuA domain-containing protein [Algoriphagus ratkowskyi]PZX55455.1 trehalose utilization protein [Algoriphagus ratkowskyi]TXD79627.1 ThuA domain-containing protein [Algoriphagus ratkowskyi]